METSLYLYSLLARAAHRDFDSTTYGANNPLVDDALKLDKMR
jgi:hypothetical protein